jgi:Mg2+/Co2+ transporter CorB
VGKMKGGKMRNVFKKEKEQEQESPEIPKIEDNRDVQIIEREINLNLLNDKLNYITGLVLKLCEAAEIETK